METKSEPRLAFEDAISKCWNELHRRAVKAVGRNDSEDLVMSVFAEVLAHQDWERIKNPRSWAIGQLGFQIMRFHRARISSKCLSLDDEGGEFDGSESVEDFSGDLVDRMARDQEIKTQVDRIMTMAEVAGLSSKEHYIFMARLRDIPYGDIGRTLGIETNAVRDRYSKALKKIRAIADQGAVE